MDKNKLINVLEGVILVVLGILVAINGFNAINIYFGIVAVVIGSVLLLLAAVILAKSKLLPFGALAGGAVSLTVGIAILMEKFDVNFLFALLVLVILGLGAALVLYGIYSIAKKLPVAGIIQIVLGALMLTFSIVYMNVEDFHKPFWIIIGILIALYGVLVIVLQFVDTKKKK